MTTPLLTASGLSPGYANNRLFDNLNLALQPGQLVCLMGPNGCGKSTLIRTLAKLQTPLRGSVLGANEKNIAVVLTDRVTSPTMSAYELIAFGRYPFISWDLTLSDEDREIIDQAIQRVRVGHLANKKIGELSDGQLQMIMIARALAQNTPVILLDEPTAHLDLNNRVEIMNLLKELTRSQAKAILVSTHELDLALQTADLIWLSTGDRKIKTGIPEDLVLDGSLDGVFQSKGYDLKTGKMAHQPHRGVTIALVGSGPEYWWTKNALERNGFEVGETGLPIAIETHPKLKWIKDGQEFLSLQELFVVLIGQA